MRVLKATLQTNGTAREAEIELDFVSKGWAIRNGKYLRRGVLFSERGSFEAKPWGVLWLNDGPGASTRTTLIVRNAPLEDNDGRHLNGDGRVYKPANPALRDSSFQRKFQRRTPASPTFRNQRPLALAGHQVSDFLKVPACGQQRGQLRRRHLRVVDGKQAVRRKPVLRHNKLADVDDKLGAEERMALAGKHVVQEPIHRRRRSYRAVAEQGLHRAGEVVLQRAVLILNIEQHLGACGRALRKADGLRPAGEIAVSGVLHAQVVRRQAGALRLDLKHVVEQHAGCTHLRVVHAAKPLRGLDQSIADGWRGELEKRVAGGQVAALQLFHRFPSFKSMPARRRLGPITGRRLLYRLEGPRFFSRH